MEIFSTLVILLLIATAIYYIVFFSLSYYWHEAKTSYVILPVIYSFEFFLIGFLAISIVSIILNFSPEILQLWQ